MGNFFTDVIKKSKKFKSLDPVADMELLEPGMRQLVEKAIRDADANGLKLMVYETYRSQERQRLLFEQGATKLRKVGVHHFGLACDLVKDIGGHPSWKGSFALLGQIAHHNKLIWGGDWGTPSIHHTFLDEDHVQRCSVGRQASLFNGSWYPDAAYDPYQDLNQSVGA